MQHLSLKNLLWSWPLSLRLSSNRPSLSFLLLSILFSCILGCGSSAKQKRTKSFVGVSSCGDQAFEPRKGVCVRADDQCPRSKINADNSCKQLPCSQGLYFDGFFCLSQKPVQLVDDGLSPKREDFHLNLTPAIRASSTVVEEKKRELKVENQQINETNIAQDKNVTDSGLTELSDNHPLAVSFMDSCLANLTGDQKVTFLAIFRVVEKFMDSKDIAKKTWETRCLDTYTYLSRLRTSNLSLLSSDLIDVSPLVVFEALPGIEKITLSVTTSTTMSCPLTNPSRCLFIAWR